MNTLTIYQNGTESIIRHQTTVNAGSKREYRLMQEDYCEFKFSTHSPIAFEIGDWADIESVGRCAICVRPTAVRNASTGGYDYTLRLEPEYRLWKNRILKFNPAGQEEVDFKKTALLENHVALILQNIAFYGFKYYDLSNGIYQSYKCEIDPEFQLKSKLIEYSSVDILTALENIASAYECEFWVEQNVIRFGWCERNHNNKLHLAQGSVVSAIVPENTETNSVTRLYAYGASTNVPPWYRKDHLFCVSRKEGNLIYDDAHPVRCKFFPKSLIEADPGNRIVQKWNDNKSGSSVITGNKKQVLSMSKTTSLKQGESSYRVDLSKFGVNFGLNSPSISSTFGMIDAVVTLTLDITYSDNQKRTIKFRRFQSLVSSTHQVTIWFDKNDYIKEGNEQGYSNEFINADATVVSTVDIEMSFNQAISKEVQYFMTIVSGIAFERLATTRVKNITLVKETGERISGVVYNPAFKFETSVLPLQLPEGSTIRVGERFHLEPIVRTEIPINWWVKDDLDTVVDSIASNRLRLPMKDGAGNNLLPYIEIGEANSANNVVECVEIFEDIYPKQDYAVGNIYPVQQWERKEDDVDRVKTYYGVITSALSDFNENAILDELKIVFSSGLLNGMEFGVKWRPTGFAGVNNTSTTEPCFEIIPNEDYGRNLPDVTLFPQMGDKFALIGFDYDAVSDALIADAESRLRQKAVEAIEEKYYATTYECVLNPVYAANNDLPMLGQVITLGDEILYPNKQYISRIIGYSYALDIIEDHPKIFVSAQIPKKRLKEIESKIQKIASNKRKSANSIVYSSSNGNAVEVAENALNQANVALQSLNDLKTGNVESSNTAKVAFDLASNSPIRADIQSVSNRVQTIEGNYVTLDGTQTISGLKVHKSNTLRVTDAQNYNYVMRSTNTQIPTAEKDYAWQWYHWYADSNGTITDSRRGLALWSYDGENKVFNNVAKFSAHNGNQFRVFGEIRGQKFVRDNGKVTEFLKADGSVDSTTYTPTSRTEALESWKTTATTTLADHETRIVNLDTDLSSLEGVVSNKADKHDHPYLGVDAQAKDSAKLGGQLPTYYAKTSDLSAHISSTSAHTFASITNKPTTVAGYGITDINQYAPKKTDYDAFVAKITKAFTINNDGSVVANIGLSSKGYLSALGTDTTSIGGSGGVSYGRIDNWGELTDSDTSSVPQAKLVKDTLDTKVDKVNGKVLSSNDYTDAEKNKLAGIAEGANNYVHPDFHSISVIGGLNTALNGKSDKGHHHEVNEVNGLTDGYINSRMRLLPSVSDTITDRAKFISSDGDGNIHVSMYLRSVTELWDYVNTKASAKYATITSVNDKLNAPNTVKEANLGWGGRDISGNVSPIDTAMISNLSANRLAFAKVEGMTVEFSRDGGETWSPYNCQDYHKTAFMNGGTTNFFLGGSNVKATTDCKLRMTLRGQAMGIYCQAQKLFVLASTQGAQGSNVIIERAASNTPNDFKPFKTIPITGWPAWNSIDLAGWGSFGMFENNATVHYDMRLTFGITGVSSNENYTSALAANAIMMVASQSDRWNSKLAETGHLYSYDNHQNATFPATLTATKIVVKDGTASQFVKANGTLDATQYAPKASTLGGYGITDAYTKTESDKNYFSSLGSVSAANPMEIGGSTFGSLLCNGVLPDGLTDKYYNGQHIAINNLYSRFEMYVNHRASSYTDKRGGIAYRSGWADKQPWVTILDSNNYATWLNSTYYTRAEIDNKIKLGIQYLSPVAVPTAMHQLTYYSGQPLLGETDGSAKEGSHTANFLSYPKGGTYANSTTANVMRLRMSFSSSHHHEIFSSPNRRQIWHRWVAGSTAYPWSRIVLEDNETETTSSYNIKVRDAGMLGGQLPAYYAKQVDLDAHKSDWSVFKAAFDKAFSIDSNGAITAKVGLSSNGWLSALGCDTTGLSGSGGSGAGYNRIDLWSQLGAADTTSVPQAKLVKDTLDTKVDKVAGKILSSNDFTDGEKAKLAGIADGANNYTHPVSHSISEVEGLQSALNGKAPAHDHPYASNSHDHDATYSKVGHSHTKSEITDFAHKHVVGDITGLSLDWGSITGKPATYEPSTHTHDYAASDHNHDDRYPHFLGEQNSGGTAEAAWGVNGVQDFSNTLPVGLQGKGAYSYGGVASFSGDKSRLDIYFSHIASTASSAAWTKGLWYRTGWQDDKRAWACVLDSGNYEDWVGQKFGSKADTDALLEWKGNINTWKSSVDSNIANLDTDLGNLETTVAGQASELGDVNTTVEALQTKCANLEAQIAELKAALEAMFKLDANGNIKVLRNIYSVGSVSALNTENQQGGGGASSGGNLSQIGGIGEIDGGNLGIESAPAL